MITGNTESEVLDFLFILALMKVIELAEMERCTCDEVEIGMHLLLPFSTDMLWAANKE